MLKRAWGVVECDSKDVSPCSGNMIITAGSPPTIMCEHHTKLFLEKGIR